MKKNRVTEILNTKVRNRTIVNYMCTIIIVTVLTIALILLYVFNNKKVYVTYKENSNVDYKVYLKENKFFQNNFLDKGNQYIASIIDYINATFNYELKMEEENVDYRYSYEIKAEVNVKEKKTENSLYKQEETLISEKSFNINSNKNVKIGESLTIDYNRYNELIKQFINMYDLDDIESTLNINMYVNVISSCDEFAEDNSNQSVVTLSIPLTTKTVGIDINSNIIDNTNNILACKDNDGFNVLMIVLILTTTISDLALIICLMRYVIGTRTAESIYDRELKKILNNYRSYIQKINNNFDLSDYQVLNVDTFNDMLEIRDTIQEPILMVENKGKTGVYFLIPSKTKILYSYGLKVSDIKKKLNEETMN